MRIEINPLSVNQAWQGKRYKTPKYKAFEKELMLKLRPKKIGAGDLKVTLVFGFSSPLSDIDNPLKPTLDVLQKKYGFNDRQIKRLEVRSEQVKKGKEFIDINIKELKKPLNFTNGIMK